MIELKVFSGRQIKMYALKTPPRELGGVLPQELFDKSQSYGLDKTRYALVKAIFDQGLAFCLIRAHVYSRTWDSTGRFMDAAGLGQDRTVSLHQSNSCEEMLRV